ncbi:TPA: hypothetical protein ACGW5N_003122 [Bacillus mobilis]
MMRVKYRDEILKEILVTNHDDVAGLVAVLEVTKEVKISGRDYKVVDYKLHYGYFGEDVIEPEFIIVLNEQ